MKFSLFCLISSLFTSCAIADLTTEYLAANGLNFTCTVLKRTNEDPNAPLKEIMLVHGFPMYRKYWHPLMLHWDSLQEITVSVHAVACDMRGYSPGASPDNIQDYDYSILSQDIYGLAAASGFDHAFHLVGHDHGAGLAWFTAGTSPNPNRFLSLTTMSVPHIDVMSDALCGPKEDLEQVIASYYFNRFSLPDSATINNASLTTIFENALGPLEPTDFQKLLWWYNGTLGKYWSLPRVVSKENIVALLESKYGMDPAAVQEFLSVQTAIPMEERPCVPQGEKIGAIEIPTLFICGATDGFILCNHSYVYDYPPDLLPNYEHVNFECGHEFFQEGNCSSQAETQAVMDKMTAFLFGNKTGPTHPSKVPDASSAGVPQRIMKVSLLIVPFGAVMASASLLW